MTLADDTPLAIYAFADADASTDLPGLGGQPVHVIEIEGIRVAVSEAPSGRLRPQRSLLAAHQSVVASIAQQAATLPVSFGMVCDSLGELERIVADRADAISDELARVGGCVEMGVTLTLDVPNVFEHLVRIDDELRSGRDELSSLGDAAPHDLRVAVGRRVEAVLNALRAQHAADLLGALDGPCREIIETPPSGEAHLAGAACLVDRNDLQRFERAIEALAATLDERYAFSIAGPFAPHHFVDLHLEAA